MSVVISVDHTHYNEQMEENAWVCEELSMSPSKSGGMLELEVLPHLVNWEWWTGGHSTHRQ